MRTIKILAAVLVVVILPTACDLGGSGEPVDPLPSDFDVASTIPAWVLQLPGGGRGDVQLSSNHSAGGWDVVLSRAMKSRPRDLPFSVAICDDGKSHAGSDRRLLTADVTKAGTPGTVVMVETAPGNVTPDGVIGAGEWNPLSIHTLPLAPRNDLPSGMWPAATSHFIAMAAAYDPEYVYFLFRWTDQGASQSSRGPVLQWDGSAWVPRAHAANDPNQNGLVDPGELPAISAPAEDEDRLFLMFPIEDEAGAFAEAGPGCASSCHQTADPLQGIPGVGHYAPTGRNRYDVWSWGAASTGPARHANDELLDATGLASDGGTRSFLAQDPLAPAWMFDAPPGGFAALLSTAVPGELVPAGYPQLPSLPANAQAYNAANLNQSGGPPQLWGGNFLAANYLPAFVQQAASGSAAEVEVGSSYSGGEWTVEIRRRRLTTDAQGLPREDDVQFDDDVDFLARAASISQAAQGLPFSVSVTDRAGGHDRRESRYVGPLRLSGDTSLAGPELALDLIIVDYGAGFSPTTAADFSDARYTRPSSSSSHDAGLRLKAGTDGGATLFISATWSDPVADLTSDAWSWNGFDWERQEGGEDELRFLWSHTNDLTAFAATGCASLCHDASSGVSAPNFPVFATAAPGRLADLWHFRAGRSGTLGIADDRSVDWKLFALEDGSPARAASHPDGQKALFMRNELPGLGIPEWMSPNDPGANALFLTLGVAGHLDALPFVDQLAGLPPAPPAVGNVSFAQDVQPILDARCTVCHGSGGFAGLDLRSYASLIAGGNSGSPVIPGSPQSSLLMLRLTAQLPPLMPQGGPALPQGQLDLIAQWISEGAQDN